MNERLMDIQEQETDRLDLSLRPQTLDDFTGQAVLRQNLKIFVQAACNRGEAMDHVLFYGPPGLGKTTLAQIVARELGVNFHSTSGPMLTKSGDLAAILTNMTHNDVLFIDEIHRMNTSIEEVLYPAMEDFSLDLVIGEGPSARTVKIDIPPFTLIGATTRSGLISTPLRDRFGIPLRLNYYDQAELISIVIRAARLLKANLTTDGAEEIAKRSRGTPRIAGRLLRRVRDFALIEQADAINATIADYALGQMDIDQTGLDVMDRRYMTCLIHNFSGGPVGLDTLCAALSEARDAVEDVIETYLIQRGFLQRTPRGRVMTNTGWEYMGKKPPQ